jgi:predicted dehydrogenase
LQATFPASAPVRVGVLGCGAIAFWAHLRELRRLRGVRLVGAADPDPIARSRAARLARIPTYPASSELLARRDVDAVVICAPTHLHAALAIAAAEARKHVYLEKPIADNRDDAQRLAGVVRETGIVLAVGFNRRFHPLYLQARELIRSGSLGAVRAVFSGFNERIPPDAMPAWKKARSTGGGVLLDLASHHADLLRWFLNDEVAEVEGEVHSLVTEHDEAWVRMTTRGGVTARSFFSFRAGHADFLEFFGALGTLRVDRLLPRLSLRLPRRLGYGAREAWLFPRPRTLARRLTHLVRPSHEPSHRLALADFAAVLRGAPARGASLDDGLRSLEIVLAAETSSREGRPVSLTGEVTGCVS